MTVVCVVVSVLKIILRMSHCIMQLFLSYSIYHTLIRLMLLTAVVLLYIVMNDFVMLVFITF